MTSTNKKAIISFGMAKLFVVLAMASAYLHLRFLGIPLFIIAGLCLLYSVIKCLKLMKFAPIFYGNIND